jgi:hypothetical protein
MCVWWQLFIMVQFDLIGFSNAYTAWRAEDIHALIKQISGQAKITLAE